MKVCFKVFSFLLFWTLFFSSLSFALDNPHLLSYYYYQKDVMQDPDWPSAISLGNEKKHAEAAVIFDRILNRSEDLDEKALAYSNGVVAKFIFTRKYGEALMQLNAGLMLYPHQDSVYFVLDKLYQHLGYDSTEQYEIFLRRAINQLSGINRSQYLIKLATYYGNTQSPDQIQFLIDNESFKVKQPELYYYFQAVIYFLNHRETEAIESCQKALKLDSKFSPGYKLLGFIFSKRGDQDKSLSYWLKAYELDPSDSQLLYQIANYYFDVENFKLANDYYERCVNSNPYYPRCYVGFYQSLVKSGEDEKAQQLKEFYDSNIR